MTDDSAPIESWIGRSEQVADQATRAPAVALAATLDRDASGLEPGDPLPPLWHWIYFTPKAPAHEIGVDGHPRRGGFLPPVSLPRRMWAGGRLAFHRPIAIGDVLTRTSTIADVRRRQGKTGELVFVTVRHEIGRDGVLLLTEEHDIVYRDVALPGAPVPEPAPAPSDESTSRVVVADPVLLFRYSALTFNGHRIHYDRSYVTQVEGYCGLIVHGPLIATLLVDEARRQRPGLVVRRFEFKAMQPLFDTDPFTLCCRFGTGAGIDLWARGPGGRLAMSARIEAD
ncbi:MAG: MaoC family dehydratase N-terminal domain-containing protein [Caldimonas sp.]